MHAPAADVRELSDWVDSWYRPLRDHAYAQEASLPAHCMEDSQLEIGCQFSERFLQILWNEQRFGSPLRTADGRELSVVSPGTWNVGGGPDFSHAVLRLGTEQRRGAVEVHHWRRDWQRHGHGQDPAYASVVLHVVWRDDGCAEEPEGLPCFVMSGFLAQPLRTLLEELRADRYPYARQVAPGACAVKWAMTDDRAVRRVLRVAGLARFEDRALHFRRQALAVGSEQAFYSALFEALGYRANREPFRILANEVPLERLAALPDKLTREAVLFGAAGLLPDPSVDPVGPRWEKHVHCLWDRWWRHGAKTLPLGWKRGGTRPFNSPERRLAAGVELLHRAGLRPAAWFGSCMEAAGNGRELLARLRRCFVFHSAWENARTFSADLKRPGALLGQSRCGDITVNVILPFAYAMAGKQGDEPRAELVKQAYLEHPALQHNRLLEEAGHRFLVPPSRAGSLMKKACEQQGMQEIYRSFCGTMHGNCENCPFVLGPAVDQLKSGQ